MFCIFILSGLLSLASASDTFIHKRDKLTLQQNVYVHTEKGLKINTAVFIHSENCLKEKSNQVQNKEKGVKSENKSTCTFYSLIKI